MLFAEFKAKNPGYDDSALVDDLHELCGLPGSEEYCEALDDFYSWGLGKENILRPVVISAKKTIAKAKKKPSYTLFIITLIATLIIAGWWYFKIYKNQ